MKKVKTIEAAGVLMAFILVLAMSGCSRRTVGEPETRQKMMLGIRNHLSRISEPDRRAKCLNLLNKMELGLEELNRTIEQYAVEAKRLNADYDATTEDFSRLTARYNTSRISLQQRILDAHFGIKALTTPKEWTAIAQLEEEAVLKIIRQDLLQRYANPSS